MASETEEAASATEEAASETEEAASDTDEVVSATEEAATAVLVKVSCGGRGVDEGLLTGGGGLPKGMITVEITMMSAPLSETAAMITVDPGKIILASPRKMIAVGPFPAQKRRRDAKGSSRASKR